MAVVLGVMAASIFAGSKLHVAGSISTNTGFIPFHHKECVVATKLYGVVITSPVTLKACSAVISGNVPFVNKLMYGTFKYSHNAFSNCWWNCPLLVIHLLCHISCRYGINSSNFGNSGDVTVISLSFFDISL